MATRQNNDGTWIVDAPGIYGAGFDREMAEALDADAQKLAAMGVDDAIDSGSIPGGGE